MSAALASLALACAGFGAPARAASKVTAVRFWSLGDVTRVAIEVSADFHYRSDRLDNPDRLFFDIQGAKPELVAKGMHVIAVGDELVKQIRIAETQPGVTRVVLDLAQPAEYTASQLSGPDRLMIELHSKTKGAPPITSSTGSKTLRDSPTHAVAPDLVAAATSPALNAPHIESAPIARMNDSAPIEPASTRTIDSGPSGRTPDSSASGRVIEPTRELTREPMREPKPEPKRFVAPPVLARPMREERAEMLSAPAIAPVARSPRNPLPPPVVKSDATLIADAKFTGMRVTPLPMGPSPSGASFAASIPPNPSLPISPGSGSSLVAPIEIPKGPSTSRDALPAKSNSVAGRSLTRVLGLKLGRVVIDPGHGGHDAGTHGPSGLFEKDVVLDVSKRLGALLESRLQTEVIFTRSDDTYIPLEQRTRIANDNKADLFLSIHANSSPYRTAAGVETYYLNFTTSKAALDLAARENASSERTVFELKDLLQKIALKDKIDESREFATRLQTSLYSVSEKGNAAAKNRGIKKAPFVVLIGAQMPSVLAEIGFLTNSADETLLRKPEHRQKIAEALYKGIANYADTLSHFQVAKRD